MVSLRSLLRAPLSAGALALSNLVLPCFSATAQTPLGSEGVEAATSAPESDTFQAPPAIAALVPEPPTPVAAAAAAATTPSEAPSEANEPHLEVAAVPGQGLTVRVGEVFSLNVRSRIQVRYQLTVPDQDAAGQRELDQIVNVSTARLWFSGHIRVPELTYMIQLAVAARDYRDGATSPIFDAYLDWKAHRDFAVRAGQFFVPFDRLRTVREFALQMTERPRPVAELTLDRDVGVTFYSDHFLGDESPVAWRVGVFGGGGTNLTAGREPGVLVVSRLELRPLGAIDDDREGDHERRASPRIAIGGGFAANINTNRLRSTTGTTFQGGTTDYLHAAADLTFKWRGIALQAEYLWKNASADQILSVDEDGNPVTEYTRSGQGWVVQASYTFDPPLEVVGRLSRTYAFAGTDPTFVSSVQSSGQEVGAGLNYYFNDHYLKLQADWIALMPPGFHIGRASHAVHVQVDATF